MGNSYKSLIVWQRAKSLAVETYRLTEAFPRSELYGLTSQMRRASVSIASNIAEGQGRTTKGEFVYFLGQARGSLLELETQYAIAVDLKFVKNSDFAEIEKKVGEVLRLLNALMDSLKVKSAAAGK